jgi:hypothetical protein
VTGATLLIICSITVFARGIKDDMPLFMKHGRKLTFRNPEAGRQRAGDGIGQVAAQAVQEVEPVAEREEGDGEVDGCGVDWFPF